MSEILETAVVGGGYAGLGVSYFLQMHGVAHEVLERARIGETWRKQRWDSFQLNTPHARSLLPGDSYDGPDPWGALTQHEFVAYLEDYAKRNSLPVSTDTPVKGLTRQQGVYQLATARGTLSARNLVIATGDLNCPVRPPWSANLPSALRQIDCSAYRNAAELEDGCVLVVGSGQSGVQIAEDLAQAGRSVFLATSRTGRLVRRYRGGDTFNWLTISGFLDVRRKEVMLPSGKVPPRAVLGATHTISLQSLSAQGVVLLGRFQGVENGYLMFGDELDEHLRFADEASANVKRFLDQYIERAGLDAPAAEDDPAETVEPRRPSPPIRSIDWAANNITSVIWCTGFVGDFNWIQLPGALDKAGKPIHEDGFSVLPGLYFAGLDFGSTRKSGTIPAIADEGARIVDHIIMRRADLT